MVAFFVANSDTLRPKTSKIFDNLIILFRFKILITKSQFSAFGWKDLSSYQRQIFKTIDSISLNLAGIVKNEVHTTYKAYYIILFVHDI